MKEEAGQKIAEIDAHVGRVSAGLEHLELILDGAAVADEH